MSKPKRTPDLRWWPVKLRVDEADLNEMSRPWAPDFAEGARYIVFGASGSDPELEPPSLTFELQAAEHAEDSVNVVQELWMTLTFAARQAF
jgi:hypothetical protein